MTDILARQRQLIGTTAEWGADDLVIGNGELAIERVNAAQIKIKVGDGVNKYSALPYVTSSPAAAISGGLTFKGSRDITAAAPAGAVAGDYYVASATGAPAGSWTGLGARVTKGDLILFDGTAWHGLAQDVDLTKYLALAGGTMTGPLTLMSQVGAGSTAPGAADAVSKAYVDSLGEATGGTAATAGKFPKLDAGGLVPATMLPPPTATEVVHPNLIINGDMILDQRHQGAAVTPAKTTPVFTVDRWKTVVTQDNHLSIQRNAGAVTQPKGFTTYIGATCTLTYTPAASDHFILQQNIEGFDTARLAWGTAGAEDCTLSFKVHSSLTGVHGGVIMNSAKTRSFPFSYTIAAVGVWQDVSIKIPGDAAGVWNGGDGVGVSVIFCYGAGPAALKAPNAWAAGECYGPTGMVNMFAAINNHLHITGVRFAQGGPSPFEHDRLQDTLNKCMRFYQHYVSASNAAYQLYGHTNTGDNCTTMIAIPEMRVAPNATKIGNWSFVNTSDIGFFPTEKTLLIYARAASTTYTKAVSLANAGFSLDAEI
jgi:hypothetical protein